MKTNVLIAEFMGGILSSVPNIINLPQTVGEANILCVKGSECLPNGTYSVHRINELKYHTSWDWLMPVALFIAKNHSVDCIAKRYSIEEVYKAVVEFIKWYNNLTK